MPCSVDFFHNMLILEHFSHVLNSLKYMILMTACNSIIQMCHNFFTGFPLIGHAFYLSWLLIRL